MKIRRLVLAFADNDRIILHKLFKTSELAQFNLENVVSAEVTWDMNKEEFQNWRNEFAKTIEEKS